MLEGVPPSGASRHLPPGGGRESERYAQPSLWGRESERYAQPSLWGRESGGCALPSHGGGRDLLYPPAAAHSTISLRSAAASCGPETTTSQRSNRWAGASSELTYSNIERSFSSSPKQTTPAGSWPGSSAARALPFPVFGAWTSITLRPNAAARRRPSSRGWMSASSSSPLASVMRKWIALLALI